MSSIGNKKVFSKNLRSLMEQQNKDRKQICNDLGFKYTTFSDWYNGNKYPRIDKIEMLADYFGVLKSDLSTRISLLLALFSVSIAHEIAHENKAART